MPTYAATQLAIETRFNTQWVDDSVAVRYESDPRKRPTGSFIRFVIRHASSMEKGFAGNKILYRRQGWIVAQCFVEAKKGTQEARVMADSVIAIFEGQQFSNITFREAEVVEVGDDDNGFWQVNAKVFFDFDLERTY